MKKIAFLIVVIISGLNVYANPIVEMVVEITELYFDDSDNWKLELDYYYNKHDVEITIDSVFLYSSSDSVKLPKYNFTDSTGIIVITKDSLGRDFIINRFADHLKVVYYFKMDGYSIHYSNGLVFGNQPGSYVNYPRKGQSICRIYNGIYNDYVKDNSPTIGAVNDTSGVFGTLKGFIYDKNLKPIQHCRFRLGWYDFETSDNGKYSVKVLSKSYQYKYIELMSVPRSYKAIKEFSYIMEPDSVVEMDIVLLDTLISDINDLYDENPVSIYPNPVSINGSLSVNVDLPVKTSDIWLQIVDMNGRLIRRERIRQRENVIHPSLQEGFFILNVSFEDKLIFTKKVHVKNG